MSRRSTTFCFTIFFLSGIWILRLSIKIKKQAETYSFHQSRSNDRSHPGMHFSHLSIQSRRVENEVIFFPAPLGMQVGISTNLLLFFTHLMKPLLIFFWQRYSYYWNLWFLNLNLIKGLQCRVIPSWPTRDADRRIIIHPPRMEIQVQGWRFLGIIIRNMWPCSSCCKVDPQLVWGLSSWCILSLSFHILDDVIGLHLWVMRLPVRVFVKIGILIC